MSEIGITGWLVVVLGGITILKTGIDLIMGINRPNIKQDLRISGLEKDVGAVTKDIASIKTNHLAHIERDVNNLKQGQVRIETILEERLPKKNKS
jgi:hypothetical protein